VSSNSSRRRTVVVSPFYNEEDVAPLFYEALASTCASMPHMDFAFVFVDDGSTDRTLQVLNRLADADPRIAVLSLTRNFGHQVALSAGLDFASGDAVIVLDSDLQHPPTLIPRLIDQWERGFDVVLAKRRHTEDASAMKRFTSNSFYRLFNALSPTQILPGVADFCLLSRRASAALRSLPERHRFMRGLVAWLGFPATAIDYEARARVAGGSKYSVPKMVGLAADAIFSFSPAPLKLASRLGLVITALGAAYFVFVLYSALIAGHTEPGWGSVISVVLGLGGLQLLFTGLIGEYLSRLYEEAKGRPLYVLKQARFAAGDLPRPLAGSARAVGAEHASTE
jgi:glycosyltransferase involved in cell wall biosynthesis